MPLVDLSAKEALSLASNRITRWPARGAPNRLEPACEPVSKPKFVFDRNVSIFTVGSCFARNIEEYMSRAGMDLPTMSFSAPRSELPTAERETGLLNKYTPDSMLVEVRMALDETCPLKVDDCLFETAPGQFLDLQLASQTPVTLERARQRRGEVSDVFKSIKRCDLIVITLGLIESWIDTKHDVAICHTPSPKLIAAHPDRFRFRVLTFAEAYGAAHELLALIRKSGSEKRILITTSPVPLSRTFTGQDVLQANCHSKSLLRAVAEELKASSPDVDYFPSYEAVTMTRSDLAWRDDLRHVRDEVVGRIVGRVSAAYFPHLAVQPEASQHSSAQQLVSSGKLEEAYAAFKDKLETQSENTLFLIDFARLCKRLRKFDEAFSLTTKVLELARPSSQRHAFAAEVGMLSATHLPEAETHARRAIAMDPRRPYHWILLVSILERSDQKDLATKAVPDAMRAMRGASAATIRAYDVRLLRNTCKALGLRAEAGEAHKVFKSMFPQTARARRAAPRNLGGARAAVVA